MNIRNNKNCNIKINDYEVKECEYCSKENMENKPIHNMTIETILDDIFLYLCCDCGRHQVVKINYCPMCGRKLSD